MQNDDRRYALLAGKILAEFGASIAVPAVLAALIGKYLDKVNGTAPRYLILALVASFTATAYHLNRRARQYGKEYEALDKPAPAEPKKQ